MKMEISAVLTAGALAMLSFSAATNSVARADVPVRAASFPAAPSSTLL